MRGDPAYVGRCPTCGKTCFLSRKAAKATARRLYPDERLSVYRCGDYWHYGHLPNAIRNGVLPRSSLRVPTVDEPGAPT